MLVDKFMNLGKDPARDITGNSGTDIKGAGVDTQLISANAGDIVINKEAASAVGSNYFDAISQKSGEKVSGAGPDTQMIAVRPGEIVVNKETVDAVGADHFLGLNRLFGGCGSKQTKNCKSTSSIWWWTCPSCILLGWYGWWKRFQHLRNQHRSN